jgi:hypothetical protein
VRILSMKKKEYENRAATHYRVLTSGSDHNQDDKDDDNQDARVFFEIPVEPCGYWAEANGASAENFLSRFNEMKQQAEPKVCGSLQPDGRWQLKVLPAGGGVKERRRA